MKKFIFYISCCFIGTLLVLSCTDELFTGNKYVEGKANLHIEVAFDPETGVDVATRATNGGKPGNAIQDIHSFWLVIFNADGTPVGKYPIYKDDAAVLSNEELRYENQHYIGTNDNREEEESSLQDKASGKLTFDLHLVSGNYYIYGVANVSDFEDYELTTRENLKEYKCKWDEKNIGNNSEMFGIFDIRFNRSATDETPVTVSATTTHLHCWLRRLASKVTITFDGSELYDNIQIFIDSVRVRDIPKQCALGVDNTPGLISRDEDGTEHYEPFANRYADDYANGLINKGDEIIYQELPKKPYTGIIPDNYLHICNGNHKNFSRETAEGEEAFESPTHDFNTLSLFFYENIQGEGKDKCQDADGDNQIDHPNWKPEQPATGWKDAKPYGTYIEVTGIYRNTRADGSVGMGPIVYRFMLGQNETTDYNVKRNTHYMVTMKFKGTGKDPDWHIDYKEEGDIYTVNPQYVSYLYNKQMYATVKVVGEMEAFDDSTEPILKAFIVDEGNKGQFIQDTKGLVNETQTYWQPWGDGTERFANPSIWTSGTGFFYTLPLYFGKGDAAVGMQQLPSTTNGPWTSFLSLRKINVVKVEHPDNVGYASFDLNASDALSFNESYYKGKEASPGNRNLGERTYSVNGPDENETSLDGNYTVTVTRRNANGDPIERVFRIPLFTRAKELVTKTGFSGNNPFFEYHRKEQVVFKAKINGEFKYFVLDAIQVPRIINPIAIWRDKDNSDFHVQLMYEPPMSEGTSDSFETFTSDGAWSAEILAGSAPIITLSSTVAGSGSENKPQNKMQRIVGEAECPVDFNIHFTGFEGDAVIKVRYHNFTCEHDIFVRKGEYQGTVQLVDGGVEWSLCNVDHFEGTKAVLANSPLDEGSLFRRGSYTAILSSNNTADKIGTKSSTYAVKTNDGESRDYSWEACKGNDTPTDEVAPAKENKNDVSRDRKIYTWKIANENERIALCSDFYTLTDQLNTSTDDFPIKKAYGVMYGDGSIGTAATKAQAYGYNGHNHTAGYGMRGVIIYNRKTWKQLFLPIGQSGHGRRKDSNGAWAPDPKDPDGGLRYATRTQYNTAVKEQPLFYDLFQRPGAIYWCRDRLDMADLYEVDLSCALDINFFTMGFEGYRNSAAYKTSASGVSSDACFIRTVHDTNNSSTKKRKR